MDTFSVIVLVAAAQWGRLPFSPLEGQSLRGSVALNCGRTADAMRLHLNRKVESAMNQGVGAFPPSFVVSQTRLGATLNLAVAGDLDASNAPELRAEIFAAGADWARLVIDLTDLTFIDSVGLSILVAAKKLSREKGFELFVIPSEHDGVKRVFELTETGEVLRQDPDG